MSNLTAFESIRPTAVAYADHARKADRAGTTLKGHADLPKVWEHYDALCVANNNRTRGVMLQVARDVLGLSSDVTLTRDGDKPLSVDAQRLENLKKWLDRNLPKAEDDTPAQRVLRVSLSGEGGGTVVVPEDHALYAALVALITGDAGDAGQDNTDA